MFKCPFSFKKCSSKSSARVASGKLILSFPKAITPVVWQVDLNDLKASTFEIQHDEKDNSYALTINKPQGKAVQIAQFSDQDQAAQALMDTADALANAHYHCSAGHDAGGHGAPVHHMPPPYGYHKPRSTLKTIIMTILVLLGLLFVITFLMSRSVLETPQTQMPSSRVEAPANMDSGVPLSADDFLRGQ